MLLYFTNQTILNPCVLGSTGDPCECDSLVKFQKKVEAALQALTKKHILYDR